MYILDTSPSSDMCFVNIFSPCVACFFFFFILLLVSFEDQMVVEAVKEVGSCVYFKSTGYADELDVGCGRKRGVKNDIRVFEQLKGWSC